MDSDQNDFVKKLAESLFSAQGADSPFAMNAPEAIKEPSATAMQAANLLRDQYLALIKTGFTQDEAIMLVLSIISASAKQAGPQ